MGSKYNNIKTKKFDFLNSNYYFLAHEKSNLEKNYDFLSCTIKKEKGKRVLEVHGHYQQVGKTYTYKIVYDGVHDPQVFILSPSLVTDPPHTYPKDKSLCLYYPKEQPWNNKTCSLYSHIIPWTHEWILFYEIWLITGNWEHPEIKHGIK